MEAAASLLIESSTISGNTASTQGGGIFVFAFLSDQNPFSTPRAVTISRATIADNKASNRGGGLFLDIWRGQEALVSESRITGNEVLGTGGDKDNGGGIYAYFHGDTGDDSITPRFTITGSSIDNNSAVDMGGGIFVCMKQRGVFVATNSTFSTNRTTDVTGGKGGGLMIARREVEGDSGDAFLRNITVTQNWSASGGGIEVKNLSDLRVRIGNSIISENFNSAPGTQGRAFNNLVGRVDRDNFQHNLIGTGSTVRNLQGTIILQDPQLDTTPTSNITFEDEPLLTPLGNHGGPTPTHGLRIGSPAIDAGSNALAADPLTSAPLTTDQRGAGFTRIFDFSSVGGAGEGPTGFAVDIGAYEINPLLRIADVVVKGPWLDEDLEYSFARLVPQGQQLRPIFTENVDTVEIHFDGPVSLDTVNGSNLRLRQTVRNANGSATTSNIHYVSGQTFPWTFEYFPNEFVARWTMNSPLSDGKYAIHLTGITGVAGQAFDGDWVNETAGTPDDFSDDPMRPFVVGNGVPDSEGGEFRFHFALLAGDYDGNGVVEATELVTGDGDGDGVIGDQDDIDLRNMQAAAGKRMPLLKFGGPDFNDDEQVDGVDLTAWISGYAGTGLGDVDADGDVDGADDKRAKKEPVVETGWAIRCATLCAARESAPRPPLRTCRRARSCRAGTEGRR